MPHCPQCPHLLRRVIFLGGMFYFYDNQHCPRRHQYMVTHINHYNMNKYVCIIFTCPHCPQCPQCPHLLSKIIWIVPLILTCPHCPQCPHLLRRVIFFRGGMFYFDDNQHCPLRHQYMVTHVNHYIMNEYVCIFFTFPHFPQCPQCPHL